MKLLLTSVGSLVGQNILDVLEYPGFSRRSLVEIVGTNSLPDAACNFRCDRCYLVPPTAAPEYSARMREILLEESPDLILSCRDEDTYVLSQLRTQSPELPGAFPIATSRAALIGLDKWQTYLFARKHALPFAESFVPGQSDDGMALDAFCRKVGYPAVAKPVRGAGSRGVFFLRNEDDARVAAQWQNYLFQEYVGDLQSLRRYFAVLEGPPPLFAQSADGGYHVSHTMIAPGGDVTLLGATENLTVHGHSISNRVVSDPALNAVSIDYARALFLEGGSGPMGLQLRRDRAGVWKVLEINLRTTGGTLARFLRGIDELYLIVKNFLPGTSFPELHPIAGAQCEQVHRQYYSYPIFETQVSTLRRSGVWSR